MATKKPARQTKNSPKNLKRILLIFGSVAVVVAIAVLVWFLCFILYRLNILEQEGAAIKPMIVQASENLNHDAVIEPSTGKVYIPEKRLVFQYNPDAPRLAYSSYEQVEQSPAYVMVANRQQLDIDEAKIYGQPTLIETFDRIPAFQACTRQIQIYFGTPRQDQLTVPGRAVLMFTKKLADGRTVTVYTERNSDCEAPVSKILPVIQTIDSY